MPLTAGPVIDEAERLPWTAALGAAPGTGAYSRGLRAPFARRERAHRPRLTNPGPFGEVPRQQADSGDPRHGRKTARRIAVRRPLGRARRLRHVGRQRVPGARPGALRDGSD